MLEEDLFPIIVLDQLVLDSRAGCLRELNKDIAIFMRDNQG